MSEENVSRGSDPGPPQRIGVKQAVRRARDFLIELYEDEDLSDARLEEVELSDDGSEWRITFGFLVTETVPGTGLSLLPVESRRRDYKLITVDAYSGEPQKMKIRTL